MKGNFKRGERYGDELRQQACDLYKQTHSFSAVANELGINSRTVRDWCIKAGVATQRNMGGTCEVDTYAIVDITAELAQGHLPPELATRLKSQDSAAWRALGEAVAPGWLAPWQAGAILSMAAKGLPLKIAASKAGVDQRQVGDWLTAADAHREDYEPFVRLMQIAQGACMTEATDRVMQGQAGWQGAAWLLTRLRPDLYAPKIEVQRADGGGMKEMPDETLIAIVKECLDGKAAKLHPAITTKLEEFGLE